MTDHDPVSVLDNTYKGSNIIHYVCKLGNAPILQVHTCSITLNSVWDEVWLQANSVIITTVYREILAVENIGNLTN